MPADLHSPDEAQGLFLLFLELQAQYSSHEKLKQFVSLAEEQNPYFLHSLEEAAVLL